MIKVIREILNCLKQVPLLNIYFYHRTKKKCIYETKLLYFSSFEGGNCSFQGRKSFKDLFAILFKARIYDSRRNTN